MSVTSALLLGQIISGRLVGSFYITLSLGLSLIFSLGGVVDRGRRGFYAIGAYVAIEIEKRARVRDPATVRGVAVYFYPPMAEASMYLLMVLVLLFRPRRLLGERFEKFE
jgi:branched-subunit amino acid ABC-type transport system permease component